MPVHVAQVQLLEGDPAAVGAAVTVALCGHWEHPPPCPLAPHHTSVAPTGAASHDVRVLFAADAAAEPEVRRRIVAALSGGGDGQVGARWRLIAEGPAEPTPDEQQHARALHG